MKRIDTFKCGIHVLNVGTIIDVLAGNTIFPARITDLVIVDEVSRKNPNGWDSPWANVTELVTGKERWISLNNWEENVNAGLIKKSAPQPSQTIPTVTADISNTNMEDYL